MSWRYSIGQHTVLTAMVAVDLAVIAAGSRMPEVEAGVIGPPRWPPSIGRALVKCG